MIMKYSDKSDPYDFCDKVYLQKYVSEEIVPEVNRRVLIGRTTKKFKYFPHPLPRPSISISRNSLWKI